MGKHFIIMLLLSLGIIDSQSQNITPILKGIVTDLDTKAPLAGASILELNTVSPRGTITDENGRFRLVTNLGRISIRISYLGYEDQTIKDILVASGKEVEIEVVLQEKVIQTSDVVVHSDKSGTLNINQMATISTNTIRTDDALRYAGGFYDPSRIVNAFAGVVTANSDESNDIVIRGNSSRGLLWRVEGIEVPNPNHFSEGQGGSGGAFSAITSNVIANFDFFTGAFPAEFGNACSGVMDLNLRKGNPDNHEFAFQTGMIGAEVSAEGPFTSSGKSSFLLNARYTNFKILSDLGLIDLGETNYAPRTKDIVLNINLPLNKTGNINIFGTYGSSEIGKIVSHDISEWTTLSDQWEEMEKQSSSTVGMKHVYVFPDSKTYTRAVLAFTSYSNSYREGYVDSSFVSSDTYSYSYNYPSIHSSFLINHKFNSKNTIRGGMNLNFLYASMTNFQKQLSGYTDTLVMPTGSGELLQGYAQWKYRPMADLEINSGFHLIESTLNGNLLFEPRIGLRYQISSQTALIAGFGLHSREESLAVYYTLIKDSDGKRYPLNLKLDLTKAYHWVAGTEISISDEVRLRLEGYIQYLFDVPIVNKITSQYSSLNSSERLPNSVLENEGTGSNKGIEVTIQKSFTKFYYYMITGSLFNSTYKAGDHQSYNTYYNTRFVTNMLLGKDFYVGKYKRNSIGLNTKFVLRGGYRYTPVDVQKTIKAKRIVFDTSRTYESQLPAFMRLDAGINFRRNHSRYSWIIMLDIQNVTNRKNVFRKRFSYENNTIIENDVLSLGTVPVLNFRVEF
jgi:hypothetical protein